MNKRFLLIAVLMLASISAFAQAQFSVYAGGAFPMGNFKAGELKDKYPEKWALVNEKGNQGYAGIGFNIGADVLIPISAVDGLGITIGADYFYNGYNSELKDFISDFEDQLDKEDDSYTLKKPRIMNIPVMGGVRYLYDVNDGFGLFAEAGVGLNLRMITKYKLEEEYENIYGYTIEKEYEQKYDSSIDFSFKIGAGIMLADHLSIGLDYYSLGSSKVKAKWTNKYTYEDGSSDETDGKFKSKELSCSELVLRIGYHF